MLKKEVSCGICWERFVFGRSVHRVECCGRGICWRCLRSHVVSVMDSLSEDQRDMVCPFCAEARIVESLVRLAFRSPWWCWYREAKEVERYERWSVEYALSRAATADEEILRCPGLNCTNLWVVDRRQRALKSNREPRYLWNPMARLFYSPPLCGGDKKKNETKTDARRIYCNHCRKAFCAICRRPWRQIAKGQGAGLRSNGGVFARDERLAAPTESHDFKSCIAFAGRSIDVDDDFAAVAAAADARHCTRCSMRVARSAGCNHIRCPNCATHWCFLCEAPWSNAHYACRDEHGQNYAGPLPGALANLLNGPAIIPPQQATCHLM